ncbi:TetR family transcriptional regulator [Nocardia sp. R7R-8]|uniref:TetR family transcriptional regulator n=1 Tax=Nocardia sp. R7R-8 TaxID=3459304 RepID=UPI00403E23A3
MAQTRTVLLDAAIEVLRNGGRLTLDAVAAQTGLTKPGVVYHFKTKEILMTAVVDHVVDSWEADLQDRVAVESTAVERLAAYLQYALLSEFDASDLAFLEETGLRRELVDQWKSRLDPWFGSDIGSTPNQRAAAQTARLVADGAWFDRSIGIVDLSLAERKAILELALSLISFDEA